MPLSLTLNSQTLSPRSTYYCFIYIKEGRCKAYALHRPFSTVQPLKSYSYLSSLSIPVCRLHLGKADTLALIFHCELVTFCKQEYIFYIIILESLIPLTPTALFFFIGMSVNGNFKNTPFSVCTITFWLLSTTSSSLISPSSENFE